MSQKPSKTSLRDRDARGTGSGSQLRGGIEVIAPSASRRRRRRGRLPRRCRSARRSSARARAAAGGSGRRPGRRAASRLVDRRPRPPPRRRRRRRRPARRRCGRRVRADRCPAVSPPARTGAWRSSRCRRPAPRRSRRPRGRPAGRRPSRSPRRAEGDVRLSHRPAAPAARAPRWPGRARAAPPAPAAPPSRRPRPRQASSCRRIREVAMPSTSLRRLRARRSSSVPAASMKARCSSIASPARRPPRRGPPRCAGSAPSSLPGSCESASTPRTSRTIVSVIGWSALLTTITSGISITPAFSAWIESPEPGISASTIVSAWSTMSISAWPTPTVSISTSSLPAASIASATCRAASERPPRAPREAIERMKTPGSRKWSERRIRSPSRAPRVKGLEGSIESTATWRSALRSSAGERADQGALADPGRAGEADDPRLAGARVDLAHELPAGRVVGLDQRDRPRQGALVAGDEALGERGGLGDVGHGLRQSRVRLRAP